MAMRGRAHVAAQIAARLSRRPQSVCTPLPALSSVFSPSSPLPYSDSRPFSTVKFMDEKRSGEETVYFKKEDEALLRNLLANHPEFDPKYSWNQSELGALAKDVTLACQKHGMKDPSAAFMKDLVGIFVSHGYKKEGQLQK